MYAFYFYFTFTGKLIFGKVKSILTFTNGDSGPLSNPDTNSITRDETVSGGNEVVSVDARQGK